MTPERMFAVANAASILCWILLAALPDRRWVSERLAGKGAPALFAGAYAAVLVAVFPTAHGSFSSLTGVAQLFADPWLLLAGWLHYLAFDLLIGAWEARDSVERGVPRWLLVPCLFCTLMFGPVGWSLYLLVRTAYQPTAQNMMRPGAELVR